MITKKINNEKVICFNENVEYSPHALAPFRSIKIF